MRMESVPLYSDCTYTATQASCPGLGVRYGYIIEGGRVVAHVRLFPPFCLLPRFVVEAAANTCSSFMPCKRFLSHHMVVLAICLHYQPTNCTLCASG